jgi:hypothetical protein
MTNRLLRAGFIAAVVAVVGCGSPAPSPSLVASGAVASGSVRAACDLVPDVGSAIGREPIASPNGYSIDGNERCLWVVSRDPSRYVGLTMGPSANHAATIDALGEGERIDDLGDDGRWWPTSRVLSVAVGDRSFQVDLQLDPAEATKELAVTLARQVVASLAGP